MIPRNGDPFKGHLLSRGYAPSTVRNYLRTFRGWEQWCIDEDTTPTTATIADVSRWLQDQNGLDTRIVANRLTGLRAYYVYATGTGLRPDDPTGAGCLKMLLPVSRITDPEVERLLAEAGTLTEDEGATEELDRPLDVAEVRRVFAQVLDVLSSAIGMNTTVNELLRQAAQFVEFEGWASPGLLGRRLRVNRHIATALVETLRDQGILQEEPPQWQPAQDPPLTRAHQRSIVKGSWKTRRKETRLFVCEVCGKDYEPTGSNQRRCPACRSKQPGSPPAAGAERCQQGLGGMGRSQTIRPPSELTATLTATGVKVGA
jgi:hypothetical protein